MAMVINTNMGSMNAVRLLDQTASNQTTAMERLTSGLRINKAADDAAGMAVAEGMTSQIRGTDMAIRNANDGMSLVQTLDGAAEEVVSMLQRMRELSVQSLNGTYSDENRKQMNEEVKQMMTEIDRVAVTTKFNGVQVMQNVGTSGSILSTAPGTLNVHAGWQVGADNKIPISTANFNTGISGSGAGANLFGYYTHYSTQIAGGAQVAISIRESAFSKGTISTQAGASLMLMKIDGALSNTNTLRSKWGALQNRLESTVSNLSNVNENVNSARSQIRDADFAKESADLAKSQVLQQAGMSMLSQANQQGQNVLQLLQ
ncbi:flagellin [Thiomicrorhabdus sp. ZW0627]|uniref:flagellin N-terminal helical domain-containing protein n=1 Tax=Thiomicrorhabdus sp. ZW0627 TaxID=3039774 RepID=UPI002436558D|nr:flagellin [Thiomicrorhabdus sp. ZW0627]MDG6773357.1 flagellin [Thiomicrorhabdus sp. ZW0627]